MRCKGFWRIYGSLNNSLKNHSCFQYTGDNHSPEFELNGINFNTGSNLTSANRLRTKRYLDPSIRRIQLNSSDYLFAIFAYDQSLNYVGAWDTETNQFVKTTNHWLANFIVDTSLNYTYRVTLRRRDNTDISLYECSNIIFYTELTWTSKINHEILESCNSYDYISNLNIYSRTASTGGITFTYDENGYCHITGSAESEDPGLTAYSSLYFERQSIPEGMKVGGTYYATIEISPLAHVVLHVARFDSEGDSANILTTGINNQNQIYEFTIPDDTVGMYIRYYVYTSYQGEEFDTTVRAHITSSPSNLSLKDLVDGCIDTKYPSRSIPSNSDLNSYINPGSFYIGSKAISGTLLNRPSGFSDTGRLIVIQTHNANHVYQIILGNGYTRIYARHIWMLEDQFDSWINLAERNSGGGGDSTDSSIHLPDYENNLYIDAFENLLNMTVSGTTTHATSQNGVRVISASVMYSLWDALQQKYPQYIDEGVTIGYSIDTEGRNYQAIKAYRVHPREKYGSDYTIDYDARPTIFITAGTHGGEGSPVWNIFAMIYRAIALREHSEILQEVQYMIIPVLDCWSYDHFKRYLAAAYNSDGSIKSDVIDPSTGEISEDYDANRQCIVTDIANPSFDNLNIHTYAAEARALTDYIHTLNLGSVPGDCYIDLHNCNYSLGYLAAGKQSIRRLYNVMMDNLAKDWLSEATWANGDPVDYYQTSTTNHFQLNGKILGRPAIEKSYAWFFGEATEVYSSSLLEVQQYDGGAMAPYAVAKGMDCTSRWLELIADKIRDL